LFASLKLRFIEMGDLNGDGRIDKSELVKKIGGAGMQGLSEILAEGVIASMDVDGDGTISWQEFLTVAKLSMKAETGDAEAAAQLKAILDRGNARLQKRLAQ
jgi:Ca2+-binding EF-hand superfamily protein